MPALTHASSTCTCAAFRGPEGGIGALVLFMRVTLWAPTLTFAFDGAAAVKCA